MAVWILLVFHLLNQLKESDVYVWEIKAVSIYNSESYSILVKDDEEALSKIKKKIISLIRNDRNDCKYKLELFEEYSKDFEFNADWVESLQNKLEEVSRYEFISQIKNLELMSCDVYVNKIEVI